MRKKTLKCAVMASVAGMMLASGGCLNGAVGLFLREAVIGAGRSVGANTLGGVGNIGNLFGILGGGDDDAADGG